MPAQREDRNAQLAGRALERTGSDNPIHDVGRKREAWVRPQASLAMLIPDDRAGGRFDEAAGQGLQRLVSVGGAPQQQPENGVLLPAPAQQGMHPQPERKMHGRGLHIKQGSGEVGGSEPLGQPGLVNRKLPTGDPTRPQSMQNRTADPFDVDGLQADALRRKMRKTMQGPAGDRWQAVIRASGDGRLDPWRQKPGRGLALQHPQRRSMVKAYVRASELMGQAPARNPRRCAIVDHALVAVAQIARRERACRHADPSHPSTARFSLEFVPEMFPSTRMHERPVQAHRGTGAQDRFDRAESALRSVDKVRQVQGSVSLPHGVLASEQNGRRPARRPVAAHQVEARAPGVQGLIALPVRHECERCHDERSRATAAAGRWRRAYRRAASAAIPAIECRRGSTRFPACPCLSAGPASPWLWWALSAAAAVHLPS